MKCKVLFVFFTLVLLVVACASPTPAQPQTVKETVVVPQIVKETVVVPQTVVPQTVPAADVGAPLTLARRISLPGVKPGRLDHLAVDIKRNRVILAALGNDTIEVVDRALGKVIQSIPGQNVPQAVLYIPEFDKLVVTNDGGQVNIYGGAKYEFVKTLNFEGPDNMRYDEKEKIIYVAVDEGLAMIDAKTLTPLPTALKTLEHSESFQLEQKGTRIFADMSRGNVIEVIDRKAGKTVATWPMPPTVAKGPWPMQLDEDNHRLFVCTTNPSLVVVFDTESGKIVTKFHVVVDADDIYYDAETKRIYISGGEGFVDVWKQLDPDRYQLLAKAPSRVGARTSVTWSSRAGQWIIVAAPADVTAGAELLFYKIQDY
jgi:DNA-binding beta-propeller fold protein YncE